MRKIPTLFKRDPDDLRHLLPEVNPGCEWVLAGEGVATRKYDGTCVYFDGSEWFARREVKPGKDAPHGFLAQMTDPATGKTVGWEPIAQSPFAKFLGEAIAWGGAAWPEGTYELCGPKINGNPERFVEHRLVRHEIAEILNPGDELSYAGLQERFIDLANAGIEGIVWHHSDGRMAKLKVRDFA